MKKIILSLITVFVLIGLLNAQNPPTNLFVTDGGYATWDSPSGCEPGEFRYDDGVITGQLGFNSSPNAVMGASHPNNAIIEEVTWLLTSNVAHTEAFIYIFGLDGSGHPDTGQLLHQSAALPNIDDAWNTYTLPTPIEAPNGFLVGVNTPDFIALGTDDGVGDPWTFQMGTQWGIPDWTDGNDWLDVGPAGYPYNFSIRAYGSDLGEIALAESDDSKVNHVNSGLIGSELNVPIIITNSRENRDLLGYNVYLDGGTPVFVTESFYDYDDGTLIDGQSYLAEVTADYDEGESVEIDYTFTYVAATTPDPPINVAVDGETATIFWLAPVTTIIEENFDSYNVGDYIAVVGDNWTTWSNAPGGAEDAYVTDVQSSSPSNSVEVEEDDDLVFLMDEYTIGKYSYDMKMYIPSGHCGYFNVLQDFAGASSLWGFQIFFMADGTASADANGEAALTYSFNHDEWMDLKIIVDLDNDWATYYHNGEEMVGYQWTLGCFGDPGILQFGAANIYGGSGPNNPSDTPLFYVDDVVLSELQDISDYNLYLNGVLDGTVGDNVYEYMYTGLVEDQTYTAGVSAENAGGESDIVEVIFTYTPDTSFDPPSNPAAVVDDYNDVILTWEQPSGSGGDWLSYHDDTFEGGLCSTDGGAGIAQMFQPTAYPCTIEQIEYFIVQDGDNGQEIETWIISDNGSTVLGGPYTTNVVLDWNTVDIEDIVITSGGFMIATYNVLAGGPFTGYDTDTYDGTLYFGNHTGGFTELGEYDYFGTGSHGAYVAYGRNSDIVAKHQVLKPVGSSEKTVSKSSITESNPFDCIQTTHIRDTRSLSGYKIYRDGSEIYEVSNYTTLTYTDESLDTGTYEYTITAIYTNPAGVSDPTNPVDATVVLNAPTNGAGSSQPPNVIITWSAPARGVDNYNVYRDGEMIEEGETGTMFIDINVPDGEYIYNLTAVYDGGWESELGPDIPVDHDVDADGILKPTVTELTGNYPNPFNPTTTISFSLKEAGHVSVNIYNMRGQLVKTLVNAELERDFHEIVWDGKDNSGKNTSSGVYFYKMISEGNIGRYTSTKKMILMK